MNGRVSRVGFSAYTRAGFMEAFECGTEVCQPGVKQVAPSTLT